MAEVFEDPIGLRPYDEALVNFFSLKIFPDMKNKQESITLIPTMTPRREFATQDEIRGAFISEEKNSRENYTIAVPALALSRTNGNLDLERWSLAGFRKIKYTEDGNRVLQSDSPYPIKIIYQLDAWLKYQSMANQVIRNVSLKFAKREVWLPIDFKGEFGVHSVPVELTEGPLNLTNLDPGEQERTLRYAYRFVLRAYLIPDVVSVPTVRKVVRDIYLADKNTAVIPTGDATEESYLDWLKVTSISDTMNTNPEDSNP